MQLLFGPLSALQPRAKIGELRLLAVFGAERSAEFLDVPTMREAGFADIEIDTWTGILVPAGTSQSIVERLNREMNAVISDPAISARMTEIAIMPIVETQADLVKRIADEQQKWKRVIERMAK